MGGGGRRRPSLSGHGALTDADRRVVLAAKIESSALDLVAFQKFMYVASLLFVLLFCSGVAPSPSPLEDGFRRMLCPHGCQGDSGSCSDTG
jgi:hypothetical protein